MTETALVRAHARVDMLIGREANHLSAQLEPIVVVPAAHLFVDVLDRVLRFVDRSLYVQYNISIYEKKGLR
jgi:hypothetical protein